MVFWDDLGFATNYTVEADLEFPGDGGWDYPERRIVRPGRELIGGPQALVRPVDAAPWLLVSGFTALGALYATSDPNVLCVFEQFGWVTFVDVRRPENQRTWDDVYPVRIAAATDAGVLLVLDWAGITAIGADGVRWRQSDLAYDIHVTRSDGDRIYYRGGNLDIGAEVRGSLDARTGTVINPPKRNTGGG